MNFFKDDKNGLNRPEYNVFGHKEPEKSLNAHFEPKQNTTLSIFRERNNTRVVGITVFILVILIHLWLILDLMKHEQQPITRKPEIIEISLIASPSHLQKHDSTSTASSSVAPISPKQPKTINPKQLASEKLLKVVKKKIIESQKPVEKPTILEEKAPQITPIPVTESPVVEQHHETQKPQENSAIPTPQPPPITPPTIKEDEKATCTVCPTLKYKKDWQERGWQGRVVLKFQLTADGLAENITVISSSGHELLDEAAINNIKESRFTPSNTGNTRTVTKPINFKLIKE